jgi:hypothetical protein
LLLSVVEVCVAVLVITQSPQRTGQFVIISKLITSCKHRFLSLGQSVGSAPLRQAVCVVAVVAVVVVAVVVAVVAVPVVTVVRLHALHVVGHKTSWILLQPALVSAISRPF